MKCCTLPLTPFLPRHLHSLKLLRLGDAFTRNVMDGTIHTQMDGWTVDGRMTNFDATNNKPLKKRYNKILLKLVLLRFEHRALCV